MAGPPSGDREGTPPPHHLRAKEHQGNKGGRVSKGKIRVKDRGKCQACRTGCVGGGGVGCVAEEAEDAVQAVQAQGQERQGTHATLLHLSPPTQ